MAENTTIDLGAYMSESIRRIMAKAYKNVLSNPREAKFAYRMQTLFQKSEKRRQKMLEEEGLEVPPFLISSISTTCNLHCKGCYARSNGIAEDKESARRETMAPEQWKAVFTEAAEMGINFSLLAGGEPMMRKDVLEKVAEVKDMIFPVFTNGTLIGPSYMEFLKKNLNIVPIISIEGTAMGTDERRGRGVFKRAMQSMQMLKEEDLFFGTSITVTTENMHLVTSADFIDQLRSYGCKIVFYVEYVPIDPARSIWLLPTNKWLRWRLCWHSDAASMPTSSFSLSRRRESPWRLSGLRTWLFPHRSRWFGRTLPLLAFQRQQCGGDGSARSLEVPLVPQDSCCQGTRMGAYRRMYVV